MMFASFIHLHVRAYVGYIWKDSILWKHNTWRAAHVTSNYHSIVTEGYHGYHTKHSVITNIGISIDQTVKPSLASYVTAMKGVLLPYPDVGQKRHIALDESDQLQ